MIPRKMSQSAGSISARTTSCGSSPMPGTVPVSQSTISSLMPRSSRLELSPSTSFLTSSRSTATSPGDARKILYVVGSAM